MKSLFFNSVRYVRRQLWALIVAYMLGMHNFYHGDNKSVDTISIKVEVNEAQEDGAFKD